MSNRSLPKCLNTYTPDIVKNVNGKLLIASYSINMVFVCFANLAVIVGLWNTRKKPMTRSTKLFFILSGSDLLIGFVLMPTKIYQIEVSPNVTCHEILFRDFWTVFPVVHSGLIILLVSIDRYLLIVKNVFYKKYFTDSVLFGCVIGNASLSFAWGLWYVFVLKSVKRHQLAIFFMCLSIFEAVILLSVTIANVSLLKSVQRTAKESTLQRNHDRYDQKLLKTIMLISVSLVTCYLPSVIGNCCMAFFLFYSTNQTHLKYATIAQLWLIMPTIINSGLNASILIIRNKKLKDFFKNISFKSVDKNNVAQTNSLERLHTDAPIIMYHVT